MSCSRLLLPALVLAAERIAASGRAPGRLSIVAKSWALLDAALAAARSGAGSVLLFDGLTGIGKTSLLAAAAERGA